MQSLGDQRDTIFHIVYDSITKQFFSLSFAKTLSIQHDAAALITQFCKLPPFKAQRYFLQKQTNQRNQPQSTHRSEA